MLLTIKGLFVSFLVAILIFAGTPAFAGVSGNDPQQCGGIEGEVLDSEVLNMGPQGNWIALGGRFDWIYDWDKTKLSVKNLAIIRESDCKVIYRGNVNSYVDALEGVNMRLYLGGRFSSISGKSRAFLGAIELNNFSVSGWNPGSPSLIRDIDSDSSNLFAATSNSVRALRQSDGVKVWQQNARVDSKSGPIRVLLAAPEWNRLYVGGQFEEFAGIKQSHLIALIPASGGFDWYFNPKLIPNSYDFASYGDKASHDGENVLSLALNGWAGREALVIGTGSSVGQWFAQVDRYNGAWKSGKQPVEGDVQALAVIVVDGRAKIVAGYHRSHGRLHVAYETPNFAGMWDAFDGSFYSSWWPTLRGTQTNASGGNGGVQALSATATKLYTGGQFTLPEKGFTRFGYN